MTIAQVDIETTRPTIAWRGFAPGKWQSRVNVREFIQRNYTPYEGDGAVPAGPDRAHAGTSGRSCCRCSRKEREKGVLDVSQVPSGILAHEPGYIDKDREIIVGLQTDAPLKRAIMPLRRLARGRGQSQGVWLRAGPGGRRDLHQVPQDAQRRRVRCLHAGYPQGPLLARRHRPAGCLRPRPHHRRLPPRRALRRGLPASPTRSARSTSSTTATRPRTSSACARNWPSRSGR